MSRSEVARLRAEIERECHASWQALYGLASGHAQHEAISARMRRMDDCHQHLSTLLGEEQAIALVSEVYNCGGETYAPTPVADPPSKIRQRDVHSTTQTVFRKIVLVQEEK